MVGIHTKRRSFYHDPVSRKSDDGSDLADEIQRTSVQTRTFAEVENLADTNTSEARGREEGLSFARSAGFGETADAEVRKAPGPPRHTGATTM